MPRRPKTRSSNKGSNTLRIIGGEWRGRKLQFLDGEGLRPTTDRVRETLFNWLSPVIYNARCLDLFCGSGALSLEALSRGAEHATCIDLTSRNIQQLKSNLALLKSQNASLATDDAIGWLKRTPATPFDIVFVDPPFNQGLVEPSCQLLEEGGWVKPEGYIYIETEAKLALNLPENWHIHRQKKAGQVAYYLCTKTQPSPG